MYLSKLSLAAALAVFCACAHADVNINTATERQLMEQLQNIGPAKAAAIVEYRTRYGHFTDIGQITEVGGIGEATLEMNRHLLQVGDDAPAGNAADGAPAADAAAHELEATAEEKPPAAER